MNTAATHSSPPPKRRFRDIALTLLAAAVIAIAILTLMKAPERPEPLPKLDLRDSSGQPFALGDLVGRPWVAVLNAIDGTGGSSPELAEMTADLGSVLRPGIAVVLFETIGSPQLPHAAPVVIVRGDVESLSDLRRDVESSAEDDVSPESPLIATVDHTGRVHTVLAFDFAAFDPVARESAALQALSRRPRLHATLNGTSAILLVLGYLFIRNRKIKHHLACMVGAALISAAFLFSYLQYHSIAGSVSYRGTGWIRGVYLAVLLSHTVLAAFVAPMAGTVFFHAVRRRFEQHRRLARVTLPIWLYVSMTGVLIYLMLYVWVPGVGSR